MSSSHAPLGSELEPPSTDLITLTRHILSLQYALGERATGDLTMLLIAIQVSSSTPSPLLACLNFLPFRTAAVRRFTGRGLSKGYVQIHRFERQESAVDQPRRTGGGHQHHRRRPEGEFLARPASTSRARSYGRRRYVRGLRGRNSMSCRTISWSTPFARLASAQCSSVKKWTTRSLSRAPRGHSALTLSPVEETPLRDAVVVCSTPSMGPAISTRV